MELAQVTLAYRLHTIEVPDDCPSCGSTMEQVGVIESSWVDTTLAGRLDVEGFKADPDGSANTGDTFHPNALVCGGCFHTLAAEPHIILPAAHQEAAPA